MTLFAACLLTPARTRAQQRPPAAAPSPASSAGAEARTERPVAGARTPPRPLMFGGNANFPPYEYIDATGQPNGFNVALIRALAAEAGVPIVVGLGPWRERLAALERGEVDLVTMAVTDDRARRFGLLLQTWTLQQSIVFRTGRSSYPRSIEDLGAESIATEPRALMDDLLRQLPEMRRPVIIAADNQVDALRQVLSGQATGAAGNSLALRYTANALGAHDLVEVPVKSLAYFVATQRGREAEFSWMEPALARLRTSGQFERLVERHLALPVARTSSPVGWYLLALTGGVALLWLGTFAWTRSLQRQVRVQTIELRRTLEDRASLARVLQAISGIQSRFISRTTEGGAFDEMLSELLTFTTSRYGWIAEVAREPGGPSLTSLALGGVADPVTERTPAVDAPAAPQALNPAPGTLLGAAISEGRPIVCNDAARIAAEGGLPADGPVVDSLLALPVHRGDRLVGLITIASRRGGYDQAMADALQPFVATCGLLIEAHAADVRRSVAEDERRQLEAQVQHAQKLESLGVLAGGIAHDFNNLLVGVLGHAELARMELAPDSPLNERLGHIETAALRASELTNQMLAYSGKGRFVVESVDLTRLVHEMTQLLDVSISKKAQLRYEFAADTPPIDADQAQIRQVVMNLLTNASEAIGDDAGEITIRIGSMRAEAADLANTVGGAALPSGEYVFLEVSDTGCGMDADTAARIFDPFFTTKFTGRGLGLAATLGIVRSHGGGVRIRTALEKGSTFTVLFPHGRLQAVGDPAARPPAPRTGAAAIVLVVDDEPDVRRVAQTALSHAGLSVLTASNGREALAVIDSHAGEIETIVLDMTMPIMGGEEVLARLKAMRSDIGILLSSGYTEPEVARTLGAAYDCAFIQKPYRAAALVEEVRRLLSRRLDRVSARRRG